MIYGSEVSEVKYPDRRQDVFVKLYTNLYQRGKRLNMKTLLAGWSAFKCFKLIIIVWEI